MLWFWVSVSLIILVVGIGLWRVGLTTSAIRHARRIEKDLDGLRILLVALSLNQLSIKTMPEEEPELMFDELFTDFILRHFYRTRPAEQKWQQLREPTLTLVSNGSPETISTVFAKLSEPKTQLLKDSATLNLTWGAGLFAIGVFLMTLLGLFAG